MTDDKNSGKKTYKVIAPETPILGHAPGSTFEAEIGPVQEQQLINQNALEVVSGGPVEKKEPVAPKAETSAERGGDVAVTPDVEPPAEDEAPKDLGSSKAVSPKVGPAKNTKGD